MTRRTTPSTSASSPTYPPRPSRSARPTRSSISSHRTDYAATAPPMLTIHAAHEVRYGWDSEPVKDGALAVEGDRIAALGTLTEVRERFPDARVRRWPGVLGPGRVHEGQLPDAPSPRERVHAVLKSGA